jgi:isocitrate dehydrogenase
MMMAHVGLPDIATLIHNAWLCTLEDGIHTYDIFKPNVSKEKVGTKEFGAAIIQRLGKKPHTLKEVHYSTIEHLSKEHHRVEDSSIKKELVGVDVFIQSNKDVEGIYKTLSVLEKHHPELKLTMISNRGVKLWPNKMPESSWADNWRCRFMSSTKGHTITHAQVAKLLQTMAESEIDFTHTEHLCNFNGKAGYTVAQDEQ